MSYDPVARTDARKAVALATRALALAQAGSGDGTTPATISGPIGKTDLTMTGGHILGRPGTDTGAIAEIAIGAGLSLTDQTLSLANAASGGSSPYYPDNALSLPSLADYTLKASDTAISGGATLAAASRGIRLSVNNGGGDSIGLAMSEVAALNFTYTALLNYTASHGDFIMGLCLRDAAGHTTLFGPRTLSGSPTFAYQRWNSLNSFNSEDRYAYNPILGGPMWLRVVVSSGTAAAIYVSFDGEAFAKVLSVTISSFMGTPTEVGFGFNQNSGTGTQGFMLCMSATLVTA